VGRRRRRRRRAWMKLSFAGLVSAKARPPFSFNCPSASASCSWSV